MKSLFFLVCFLLSTQVFAQVKTFMPNNNLNEEDGLVDNGMTKEMFNSIIVQVEDYYAPIVKEFGGTLVINKLWTNSTVNAQAYREGNMWYVDMFGGLARRQEVTPDGFAMVVCHEIGHHLAGYPFVQDWAANEGQSDYWAMQACAKNIWYNQSMETKELDSYAKKLCDQYAEESSLCYKSMNAGYSLANLLGSLNGQKVAFNTPDKSKVNRTNNSHPKAQCRLDTYVSGTLCDVKWGDYEIPADEYDSAKNVCVSKSSTNYNIKARPRCWFKPTL